MRNKKTKPEDEALKGIKRMMWLSVEVSVAVMMSVGIMVSGWNGGRNQWNSLNTAFKADQRK